VPRTAVVTDSKLTLTLTNTSEVRDVTRLVYRLNQETTGGGVSGEEEDRKVLKDRTSLGFEALRSLNQLSELLEKRKDARESHMNREGVYFHIGQVVQHKTDRWRAVVVGWNRTIIDTPPISSKTSLTQKNYDTISTTTDDPTAAVLDGEITETESNDNKKTQVDYILHLDEGDASLSRVRIMGSMTAQQNELEAVHDPDLQRLRNPFISHAFDRFESKVGRFLPAKVLRFEYPEDNGGGDDAVILTEEEREDGYDSDKNKANLGLEEVQTMIQIHNVSKFAIEGVRDIASTLKQIILDSTSSDNGQQKSQVLAQLEERLEAIQEGKVQNMADHLSSSVPPTSDKLAIQYLAALMNLTFHVMEVMWQRRTALQNRDKIKFPLGTVVKHKRYNFRGVVVAWDPYPKTDVSRWDGLQGIEEDVNELPFYHVITDTNDTVKAFGQERPFRYCCEENLEICPESELNMDVSIDEMDDWVIDDASDTLMYTPPDEVKFRHADSLGEDEEVMNKCMEEITDKLLTCLKSIKDAHNTEDLSIDSLFHLLQNTDNADDAFIVEETIKEIWKVQDNSEIRWRLDDGNSALMRGDKVKSLVIYDSIIEDDETCFEAWNKKATCHYLQGDMNKSMEAAEAAIRYNPRHFQALSGLGLVYHDISQYRKSAESFRKSLRLDPWSRVSSRLCVCLDTLKRLDVDEKEVKVTEVTKDPTNIK